MADIIDLNGNQIGQPDEKPERVDLSKLSHKELCEFWGKACATLVSGKRIVGLRYTTAEENQEMGWSCSAPMILLEDGLILMASQDDEGNGPGAIHTNNPEAPVIPVV